MATNDDDIGRATTRPHEAETETETDTAEAIAAARRVGKSRARAGDQDLRDAETFRALREQEK